MNGAALSVLLNISEGFLRRHDKETLQFLRYAFASNGEVKASYYAARGRQYVTDEELADLIALNESISKMLRRWQGTLDVADAGRRRMANRPRTVDGPRTTDEGRTKDPGRTKHQALRPKDHQH